MLALLTVCALLGGATSRLRLRPDPPPTTGHGTWVSFALLCCYVVAISTNLQRRTDSTSLFSQGLSTQNRVQAVVVLVLAGWAFFLVTSRRVRPIDTIVGARLWSSALIAWFAVTTVWATAPALSLYRVVELSTVWVISVNVFGDVQARQRMITLMWLAIVAGALSALVSQSSFEIVRSNTLAPIAALLGLFGLDTLVRHGVSVGRIVATVLPLSLFWAFDSLATAGALLVAAGAFLVARAKPGPLRLAAMAAAALGVVVALASARTGPTNVVDGFGAAYGKSQQYVSNWTGRLPLWEFMLNDVRRHPLGLGLGADRSLVLRDTAGEIGWAPLHAHNGFMAALYAGGFVGAVLAVTVLGTAIRLVRRLDVAAQPLGFASLTLLAVNNLTINGFAGTMSPGWLVMMAIVVSGARVFAGASSSKDHDVRHLPLVGRGTRRGSHADHEFVRGV